MRPAGRSAAPVIVALVLVALSLVSGCVTPAFDRGAYLQNAKAALDSAVSEASTAELASQLLLDGRATRAYADTVITDAETALGPIQTSFGGVDPPGRDQDALREDVLALLGDVEDALARARIAVRRGDGPALEAARAELHGLAGELEAMREGL